MLKRNYWFEISLFAIAMGLLECIVVIYLREIFYPEGFAFPLKPMEPRLVNAELLRELATILMLLSVGMIAGRTKTAKFAWFIYSFGIWDLFYYIFLKLLLGWPESLLTWDILFLLPTTWAGPVMGPVINSFSMILLAIILLHGKNEAKPSIRPFEWFLLITGSIIVIIAYTKEYMSFMLTKLSFGELFNPSNIKEILAYATSFIPVRFGWGVFLSGVALHLIAMGSLARRSYFGRKDVGGKK
jgi:hypothetical protein